MLYIEFNVIHAFKCYILCLILWIIWNIKDYMENRGSDGPYPRWPSDVTALKTKPGPGPRPGRARAQAGPGPSWP